MRGFFPSARCTALGLCVPCRPSPLQISNACARPSGGFHACPPVAAIWAPAACKIFCVADTSRWQTRRGGGKTRRRWQPSLELPPIPADLRRKFLRPNNPVTVPLRCACKLRALRDAYPPSVCGPVNHRPGSDSRWMRRKQLEKRHSHPSGGERGNVSDFQ